MKPLIRLLIGLVIAALAMTLAPTRAAVVDVAVSNSGTQPPTTEPKPPSKDSPTEPMLIACISEMDF